MTMTKEPHHLRLFEALNNVPVRDKNLLRSRLPWYHERGVKMDPPFAFFLDDKEILICAQWFAQTTDDPFIGDAGFIAISLLSELILANQIERVIQLGHYAGFSSLIIGMMLSKVSSNARLVSFDIDHRMTCFCDNLMVRAGLEKIVKHVCIDSTDPITLNIAGLHLNGAPGLIFIDASKQYQNTIKEVSMWSNYINGYIVAHDVSVVAKSDQANGALGVSDGLIASGSFSKNELLIIDPHSELSPGFPYLDPCGLGIGLSRGEMPLPNDTSSSINDLRNTRRILETSKLKHSENWFLGQDFHFMPGKIVKVQGATGSWVTCFAPIEPRQALTYKITLEEANDGEIMICGGGNPGTTCTFSGAGIHTGDFICGNENSLIGIYGAASSKFIVTDISISHKKN